MSKGRLSKVIKDAVAQVMSNPFFAMITTLAILAAGVCASLFTQEIQGSLNFTKSVEGYQYGALTFWGFLLLAGFLFWANQTALGHREGQVRAQLNDAVRRLNTLPSETFLPSYKVYWDKASVATLACIVTNGSGHLTLATVEQTIRGVLLAILEAAKDFDGKNNNVQYAANLMLWRDAGNGIEDSQARRLMAPSPDDAGYLELVPILSAVSPGQAQTDTRTGSILLPIPRDHQHFVADDGTELLVLLPGAPLTFATGNLSLFTTISSFIDTLKNKTTLDDRVKRRVADYFIQGSGTHIRSFASFALMPASPDNRLLPLGVLNLHSQETGLLEDNGDTLFAPLLEPFLTLLAVLITLRAGILSKKEQSSAATPGQPLD